MRFLAMLVAAIFAASVSFAEQIPEAGDTEAIFFACQSETDRDHAADLLANTDTIPAFQQYVLSPTNTCFKLRPGTPAYVKEVHEVLQTNQDGWVIVKALVLDDSRKPFFTAFPLQLDTPA